MEKLQTHNASFRSGGNVLRRLLRLVVLILLPASTSLASGLPAAMPGTAVDLAQLQQKISLNDKATIWLDESGRAELQDVPAPDDPAWQTNTPNTFNFGQSSAAYWFSIPVTGLQALTRDTYLRLDYPHLDTLDVYFLDQSGLISQYHTGDTRVFDSRPVRYRTFLFPLNGLAQNDLTLLLRVASEGPLLVPLDIVSRAELDAEDKELYLWIGAYFGIMLVMLLYNGFIFLFVRDPSYLLYILYIAATTFLQYTLYGFSFEYLWPDSTTLNNVMILVLTGLMPFCAIAFVRRFIGMKKIGTRLENSIAWLLNLSFATVFVGAFTLHYMTVLKLAHALSFIGVTYGFYLGIRYWLKGIKAARIFGLAWFVYMLFIFYYLFDIKGFIQPTVISRHALEIGSVLELVLLSLAFADRLNAEKELRIVAQMKLNEDLDSLVRERTDELEQANLKLKEISITDGLTGLVNRRHFDELFAIEYQRAFREQSAFALLMIDVDHFKQINDTHGHQMGDLCLRQVAEYIRKSIRRPPDIAARYGGEEFIVLLPNTSLEGALCVAETLREGLSQLTIREAGQSLGLTVSIGVNARIPEHRDGREKALKVADACLYQAKHQGRNQVVAEVDSALPTHDLFDKRQGN